MADSKSEQTGIRKAFRAMATAITSRAALFNRLGKSFGGDRDLYTACGYPESLTFSDYYGRYERQDIAQRIVNAYPEATWRLHPEIKETEDSEPDELTEFEQNWVDLEKKFQIYHYMDRLDKVAGIGDYAVLLLGFDDTSNFEAPVQEGANLIYLQVYAQPKAPISGWVKDASDPRFGRPEQYTLTYGDAEVSPSTSESTIVSSPGGQMKVHYSRILHVADGTLTNEVYGIPRLRPVYNRLQDLETIVAGSAEMFWKGGFPGYAFELDPEADIGTMDVDNLTSQIESFMHNMTRFLRLQGIKTTMLKPEIADPDKHVDTQLKLISGTTGIPLRILTGSERGQLASTQDTDNWDSRVDERRVNFAEPVILRPFVNRLIEIGALAKPNKDFDIVWPDIKSLSEKARADIARVYSEAIARYAQTPGIERVMPPEDYLSIVIRLEPEQIDAIKKRLEDEFGMEAKDFMSLPLDHGEALTRPAPTGEREEEPEAAG